MTQTQEQGHGDDRNRCSKLQVTGRDEDDDKRSTHHRHERKSRRTQDTGLARQAHRIEAMGVVNFKTHNLEMNGAHRQGRRK